MKMVWLAIACIAGPVLGAWAHELAHAAAARLLGATVADVDLLQLHVLFQFDEPAPRRERLVLLAPAIVGIAVVPIALALWDGVIDAWTLIAVLTWTVFALNGGAEGELRLTGVTR